MTNRPERTLRRAMPPGACDAHLHVFDPRFAVSPHWRRTPPTATVEDCRRLQARLGTARVVVVNPSTYGTNNACTLDAIAQLGAQARGVAVVDTDVTDAQLAALDAQGIRGVRVNFVTPQSWGVTLPDRLDVIAHKAAAPGWHVQVFAHAEQLIDMAAQLDALPAPLVIDHLGLVDPREGVDGEGFTTLRRLLDNGRTWVKLSGAYMRSRLGAPGYDDVRPVAQALVRHAPDRLVWGSDWPHTTEASGSVDDGHLVDALQAWCEDEAAWHRVLVDNPAALYGFDALEG